MCVGWWSSLYIGGFGLRKSTVFKAVTTFHLILPYTSEVQYDDGETQFWTVSGLQLL